MRTRASRAAFLGMYCAAAILLGYVELLIPVFTTVPGMKLGLPNLAIVTVLYLYSWKEAAAVSFIRIAVVGLLFGNLFSVGFSLAGGALSLAAMALLKKADFLSCTGVSMAGGIVHNAGQIIVAAILVDNIRVAYYFIPLAVSGLAAGIAVGVLSGIMTKRLAKLAPKL